jgi:hypothetical protein
MGAPYKCKYICLAFSIFSSILHHAFVCHQPRMPPLTFNSQSLSVGSVINEMQSKMTDRLTGLCSRVEPRQGCLRRNEASRRLTPPAANLTATSSTRRS